jgi:hypothetical protein
MIHTIAPLDMVLEGMDKMEATSVDIVLNGITMQVQPVNATQATIVRLISGNPQDYLNPSYSPGRVIEFKPVI